MPRLLPPDLLKLIARILLVMLYEEDPRFTREWDQVKHAYVSLVNHAAQTWLLVDIERILMTEPPKDIIRWVSDLQELRNYIQHLQGLDLSVIRNNYDKYFDQLSPYVVRLNKLCNKWNLRASWAGEELMASDIYKIQKQILQASSAVSFIELLTQQIITTFGKEEGQLLSDNFEADILSLYYAGGRLGFIREFSEGLKKYERDLRLAGAIEPPSALRKHAEWWFNHYVNGLNYNDIANKIAQEMINGGPHPENIRKEVIEFSKLIDIKPKEL
jgi:hypothetical protein